MDHKIKEAIKRYARAQRNLRNSEYFSKEWDAASALSQKARKDHKNRIKELVIAWWATKGTEVKCRADGIPGRSSLICAYNSKGSLSGKSWLNKVCAYTNGRVTSRRAATDPVFLGTEISREFGQYIKSIMNEEDGGG